MPKTFVKHRSLWIMVLPGLIYLLINNYLPMFGTVIAFKDFNYTDGLWGSAWSGLKNFQFLFATQDAYVITRNTLLYNAVFIVFNLVLALTVALLLNEIRRRVLQSVYQSILLLPYLISFSIVGYLVYSFLSMEYGFINTAVLEKLGLPPVSWYMEAKYWPFILVLVNAWKYIGYSSVIYLAAMTGINQEYYEAARIDGANRWKQMTRITLPLIKPVIIVMMLLLVGRIFYADFGLFYQVTLNTGILLPTTNVIDTYVYRALIQTGDVGMSSAAGLFQSVVGFLLVFSVNLLIRKFDRENALF
ncbi:ABC transporter permease [Cohnella phaseoli]|uniref:Putative aldouronate transport system permease protein n=1 Tax=Cohnella phaseoli TaxID=456490 RepID=A0A3D9JR01_9BACL|nr:ABC transporter permease subunit [Cohnella phaseoli]RED76390.1 putative aldouronate transport system permease protein [Cohnella phaseoli]